LDLHGFSVPTETLRSQQPLYIDDLSLHSEYSRSQVAREVGIKTTFAAAIRSGPEAVGALEFFFQSDRTADDEILLLVEGVAIELGRAFERDRAKKLQIEAATELKREHEFLEAVFDNLRDGVVACDADGVITVFNKASRLLHERSEAAVPTEDWAKEFDLYQPDLKTPMQIEDIPLKRALSGEVVKNAEFAIVPKSGKPRIISSNGQAMFGDDGEKLGAVITLHDLTEQREAAGRLAHSSLHDPLTDLGNRSLFKERLTEAAERHERTGSGLAAVVIDIDDFSLLNEELGHGDADQILILIADRLRSAVKDAGLIARWGADEFAILCEKVADEADAERLAEKLLHELQLPISVRGRGLTVRACVGIALATPPNQSDEIMRDAEIALRRARHLGKNQVQIFTDVMRGEALERDRTKMALGRALSNGEFILAYQPKILLETNQIVGVEALLRWKDPERGNIPPLDFIPLAEETGLIVPIGAWVIDEACAQIARWSAWFPWHVAPKVCVNVSGSQFHDGLVETVRQAISASGIDPSLLVLELTESILIEDISATLTKLHELKELGVSLSIDDFGTGYSSLAYLKRYPIDEVKIDRSFIDGLGENPEDTAIVAAIMGMAHALDLLVVAEGIENLEQLTALKTLGCEMAQGFYFCRPEPAEKITNLLLAQSGGHALRSASIGDTATELRHNTILVVDDAADVLQLSRASLISVGFNVLEAKTGTEAIGIARKANPGCIVLDLTLPDMSGLDVCARLRRDPFFEECTIVMLTARTSSEDKASAFSLGADDYIVKPFAPRDLVSRVRVAMERRASSLGR
jgi:diguanylate cyclase (GGDEF)-like protein